MSKSDRRSAGLCAAVTILCLGILLWGRSSLLNLTAAGPFVFYLPGLAVVRAFGVEPKGWLESAVLRVAVSLAIVVIAGLALHLAGSITKAGWLAALSVITLAGCVACARERGAAVARASDTSKPLRLRPSYRPTDISTMALALCLAAAAMGLSTVISLRQHEFYYTQLWVVPKKDAPDSVVIGLRNAEAAEERYAVELLVDRRLVQSWSDVSLKPGEMWTTIFRWAGFGEYPRDVRPLRRSTIAQEAPLATVSERVGLGASPRVEALVYRSSNRSVIYRHVWSAPQCVTNDDSHGKPPCEF
jgi:uncharacterized membrane protein